MKVEEQGKDARSRRKAELGREGGSEGARNESQRRQSTNQNNEVNAMQY